MAHNYIAARLGGRCANGSERDGGKRLHAVGWNGVIVTTYAALCGVRPGPRSVGWCERPELEVTCPRCLIPLAAINAHRNDPPEAA